MLDPENTVKPVTTDKAVPKVKKELPVPSVPLVSSSEPLGDSFVRTSDIDSEYFKSLPIMRVSLQHTVSKKGFQNWNMSFVIHQDYLNIQLQLSESEYNHIRLVLELPLKDVKGFNRDDYTIVCRYRYIKGPGKYGEYKAIELIFNNELAKRYFFVNKKNKIELDNLNRLEAKGILKIDWLYQEKVLDNTDNFEPEFQ